MRFPICIFLVALNSTHENFRQNKTVAKSNLKEIEMKNVFTNVSKKTFVGDGIKKYFLAGTVRGAQSIFVLFDQVVY